MMPIEQIFETRDDAPEFLRAALLEKDGKFVFAAETAQEIGGLKKALDTERKQRAEAEKTLKQFEGVDPEKYAELMKSQEDAAAQKLRDSGDWTAREAQLRAQLEADLRKRETHYTAEVNSRDARLALMQTALNGALINSEAVAAITAAKGEPALLLPHVLRQTRITEEDGQFRVEVVDAQGQPRIADIKGTPFSIKNLIEEMKADPIYGRAFEATGAGGSGAQNGNKAAGNGKSISRAAFDAMDPAARDAAHQEWRQNSRLGDELWPIL
jgi:hypothetical protein